MDQNNSIPEGGQPRQDTAEQGEPAWPVLEDTRRLDLVVRPLGVLATAAAHDREAAPEQTGTAPRGGKPGAPITWRHTLPDGTEVVRSGTVWSEAPKQRRRAAWWVIPDRVHPSDPYTALLVHRTTEVAIDPEGHVKAPYGAVVSSSRANSPTAVQAERIAESAAWNRRRGGATSQRALERAAEHPVQAEVGDRNAQGWLGLVPLGGRPGGVIVTEVRDFRRGRELATDDELAQEWEEIESDYQAFVKVSTMWRPNRIEPGDPADRQFPSIYYPRVILGHAGRNGIDDHAVWLDATADPDEFARAARFLHRTAPPPDTHRQELAVLDHEGFPGIYPHTWWTYDELLAVGRGIAHHGEAFGLWVRHAGLAHANIDTFERSYRGWFGTTYEYAAHRLAVTGGQEALADLTAQVPAELRPYVTFDVRSYEESLLPSMHVAPSVNGGIHVFDRYPAGTSRSEAPHHP